MRLIDILKLDKKFSELTDRTGKNLLKDITDEMLHQEIDSVYNEAKYALQQERHVKVAQTFSLLLSYDLLWRRVIGSQLINPQGDQLSDNKMQFVVMVQSYFNSIRATLLGDLVNYLTHQGYNRVTRMLKDKNLHLATQIYSEVQAINNFYNKALSIWFTKQKDILIDEYLEKIYKECVEAFQGIKDTSIQVIRDALGEQMNEIKNMSLIH